MKKLGKVGRELELLPDARARADHKGREIAKALRKQRHVMEKFDIEVVDVNPIPQGVEVFARVFNKDGSQVGFGDGTVDIERFRFINPPILVLDGTTTQEIDSVTGQTIEVANLVEDPEAALLNALDHTVSVTVRHGQEKIVSGKRGSTVSTFYPDADAESTSVDGDVTEVSASSNWSTVRNSSSGNANDTSVACSTFALWSGSYYQISRAFFLFDTSSIPDTDTISAATISFAGRGNSTSDADATSLHVVASTPASNTSIVGDDFDQVGGTSFGSITLASWVNTDGTYNDITLNANGLAAIAPTGISKYGTRNSRDLNDSAPTGTNIIYWHTADIAGTTKDPKLVITHAASGPAASRRSIINA